MKKIYKKPINKVVVVDSEELIAQSITEKISVFSITDEDVDEAAKVKGKSRNLWDEEW